MKTIFFLISDFHATFRALREDIEKAYNPESTETAPESLDTLVHYLACVKKECGFMMAASAGLDKYFCASMSVMKEGSFGNYE